ncbi:MAG: hypothetical protein AABY75_09460, partial [Bacteroidota bacterium]
RAGDLAGGAVRRQKGRAEEGKKKEPNRSHEQISRGWSVVRDGKRYRSMYILQLFPATLA